jgi:hypothetical protein
MAVSTYAFVAASLDAVVVVSPVMRAGIVITPLTEAFTSFRRL